ncbi:MAG: glycosyltransferase family 4 protein [Candidatus Hodarchaeales archaeon]|jgi:glycosyltransferase involved in cell wall biosynthesis
MTLSRPLRILFIQATEMNPDIRVMKEIHSLVKKGHKIELLGIKYSSDVPSKELIEGKHLITRLNIPSSKLLKYLSFWILAFFFVCRWKGDVAHCCNTPALPIAYFLKLFKGVYLVYDSFEFFPGMIRGAYGRIAYYLMLSIEFFLIKRCDAVITVNETIVSIFEEFYSVRPLVVMNCPPIDAYQELVPLNEYHFSKKPFRVLYSGLIGSTRGYENLMKAISLLSKKINLIDEFEFLIVGDGPLQKEIVAMAETMNISEYVQFTGFVHYEEALNLSRTCHLGLILFQPDPNNLLATPNKLFDYMATGLPILGSGFKDIKRILKETKTGKYCDPTDPNKIANAILSFSSQPTSKLREMSINGCKSVKRKYNWEMFEPILFSCYPS